MNSELLLWLDHEEDGWRRVTPPHMMSKDNFVSGDREGNRIRIQYFINEDRQQLSGKVWFGPGTQGPPGHAHGGSIAAALDEAMGGAAWLAGHMVVTAKITVSFKEMLPLETRCLVKLRVTHVDRRKLRTEAEIEDLNGKTFSTACGLFMRLDASKFV